MSEPILRLTIRRRLDLLRIRQRTRQLVRLLGLELKTQLRVTAIAFEFGYQLLKRRGKGQILLELSPTTLKIAPVSRTLTPFELPLDGSAAQLAHEDILFAIKQLEELTPLDPLEEMRLYDQELMWFLQQLDERGVA